jgi:hypothetical protein
VRENAAFEHNRFDSLGREGLHGFEHGGRLPLGQGFLAEISGSKDGAHGSRKGDLVPLKGPIGQGEESLPVGFR